MHFHKTIALMVIAFGAVALSLTLPAGTSAGQFRNPFRKVTTIEKLAGEIDHLERHVEEYGSVVAKQPNVWGQSRLTKFRQEYETQLAAQLGTFKETIQATIKRSDQAFFASAAALQAAATGSATPSTTNPLGPLIGDVNADKQTIFIRDPAQGAPGGPFLTDGTLSTGVSLEPTVVLDQMSRYLNHLHELRRINTGDDTAASPGYALYMLRFPVSVLPGKKTREGYGAEVTISIDPYLSDDLLPSTFRMLVINDVIDQFSVLATKALNDECTMANVNSYMQAVREREYDADQNARAIPAEPDESAHRGNGKRFVQRVNLENQVPKISVQEHLERVNSAMRMAINPNGTRTNPHVKPSRTALGIRNARLPVPASYFADVYGCGQVLAPVLFDLWDSPDKIDGCDSAGKVVPPCNPAATGPADPNSILHLVDVEALLDSELQAAYDFLALPTTNFLWTNHCTQNLAHAIREHRRFVPKFDKNRVDSGNPDEIVYILRKRFFDEFKSHFPRATYTATASLAWAIIVEAALLNEVMLEDLRQTATAKNCACTITDWMPLFLPEPPFEARESFRQYVRCRWPVHVFAIDPVTQDQNVADSFSRRREMQLALSLAFAGGQVGAQSFTRFARRLELDMDTIALNRTIVGFSHGNETFGWRFYPRVQTPDTESNATVLFRDLLWGGPSRDCEMRAWRLESGIRECTALVIMPSFVPYVTYDVRANWFQLTKPHKKQLDVRDAAELSRSIQSMRMSAAACIKDECLYRDGEVHRLLKAVDQIEARLPMQSAYAQIPFENTLSGFELVDTGVTALAPELRDWYGGPGVDVANDTELFLIGDHFSVHETTVLIGNKKVSFDIVNRQVVKVLIPKGVRPLDDKKYIEARVATPYGVSAPISIPVVTNSPPTLTGYKWDPDTIIMYYNYDADGHFIPTGVELADPKSFAIAAPAGLKAFKADLDLAFKTVGGANVGASADASKFTLTNVPFKGGKFVIGTDGGKYAEAIGKIDTLFSKFFKYSGKPADDIVTTVKIRVDGRTDGIATDNNLTIKLVYRSADDVPPVPPAPGLAPAAGAATSGPALPKTSLRTSGRNPFVEPATAPAAPGKAGAPAASGSEMARARPAGKSGRAPNRAYLGPETTPLVQKNAAARPAAESPDIPSPIIRAQYIEDR